MLATWQRVWREGFAPLFGTEALQRLATALETDDLRLLQGSTTNPPPLMAFADWPVEGCDAIGFTGWTQDGATVGEIELHFARSCFEADQRLGEPAACRWFLNWYDDTPRNEMRASLLAELKLELEKRECVSGRN